MRHLRTICFLFVLQQALSAAYQPIGAVLMSQHIFDEIAAHSNDHGKLNNLTGCGGL